MNRAYIIIYIDNFGFYQVGKVFSTESNAQSYIIEKMFNTHNFDEDLRKEGMSVTKENLYAYFDGYLEWELEEIGYTYIVRDFEDA